MDSDQPGAHRASTPGPTDRENLEQGRRAFERGDDEVALRHLERVVASGLRFADVHYRIGIVHERRGDLEAAAASLREAIRINPAYLEALLALASVCELGGDYDQARGLAERAGQLARPGAGGLDPTTRGKLANQQAALGDALASAGLLREAIEQYRQALDRCPTYHDIRHRLGVTLRDAGLPFQALQEFERILDVRPELAESRIQLGLTSYAMGRPEEARQAWSDVLAIDPTQREAAMYLRLVDAVATVGTAPSRERAEHAGLGAQGQANAPTSAWSTIPLAVRARESEVEADAFVAAPDLDRPADASDLADPAVGAFLE